MTTIDCIVIFIYLIIIISIGIFFSTKMKDSDDMFVAGRNSSWWISGLSGYMAIFTAGTFVVWGGIAYRSGLVAVSILMTIGFSLLMVARFIAGKWREIGIRSPAEFLGIRFGKRIVKLYTFLGVIARGISGAVALYAVSILLVALVPLPEGHLFCDPQTGNLSVIWAVLAFGITSVICTMSGGLWAVLITDVIQFLLLSLMVVFLIPLSLEKIGGVSNFIVNAPDGFFNLVSNEYSFIWLILWFFLWFFQTAGDWPFVQRYISVPSSKDSKKVAFLMGALYIVTPIIWMLPSMIYREINPNANPEQAYILVSQLVLPAGMLGLMMASMLSATLSTVNSMLNVFAGVFTNDIYRSANPTASERKLIHVGRVFTLFFGVFIIGLAVLIPFLGGAEEVVVTLITMIIGPLTIPSVWGLFSKYINRNSVWLTLGITYSIGIIVKLGFSLNGFFSSSNGGINVIFSWIQRNSNLVDALIGLVIPVIILMFMEILCRRNGIDYGWHNFRKYLKENKHETKISQVNISNMSRKY